MSRFEIGLVNRGRGGRGKILIYNIVLWALCIKEMVSLTVR